MVASPMLATPKQESKLSWQATVALAFVGVSLGLMGSYLSPFGDTASPLWPLSGFAIAILHVYGTAAIPLVLFMQLATTCLAPIPTWAAVTMGFGGFVESLVGYSILQFLRKTDTKDAYFSETALVLAAALISPLFPALTQFVTTFFDATKSEFDWVNSCLTLLVGDALGILTITMPVILWLRRHHMRPQELGRFILMSTILLAVSYFIFYTRSGYFYLYIILPIFLVGVRVLQKKWFYLLVLVFNVIAIYATIQSRGPFFSGTMNQNLINLQLFLATIAVTALALSGFRRAGSLRNPSFALCIGWAFCGALFYLLMKNQTQQDSLRIDSIVADMTREIQDRMDDYLAILSSGVGFVSASQDIDRGEWQRFAEQLDIGLQRPGLAGIGLAYKVLASEEESFKKHMARNGVPNLTIKAIPGEVLSRQGIYVVVSFFQPESGKHSPIGTDLASESERRRTIEQAASTRKPSMTSEIMLHIAQKHGFLILMPVFNPEKPTANAMPLQNIKAFVTAPFYTQDFFHSTINSKPRQLAVEISEQRENFSSPLFKSFDEPFRPNEPFQRLTSIELINKPFYLGWRPTKQFYSTHGSSTLAASCAGTLLSLFLAGLIVNLQVIRERAERIAAEKTRLLAQREHQFAEQASTLSAIMDAVPIGIFRGNKDGELTMINEDWQNITGVGAKDALGKNWTRFISPTERKFAMQIFTDLSAAHEPLRQEFTLPRHQDEDRIVSISLVPERNHVGEMTGFLGTMNDLTEFKKTETAMEIQRAAIAHSSKMASLGEMAGGIAHEINNPLAIIHGKSRQMQKMISLGEITLAQTMGTLQLIERTTLRISKIIKGLRALSRSGERDPFILEDLHSILEQTLDLCRERFKNSGIELRVQGRAGIEIECRATQISQVLLNLLNNAFDAVQSLPDRWVEVSLFTKDELVHLAVTDSGQGIALELRERIFQPFYTTKDINAGTGLGLSISRNILDEHRGRLFVDDKHPHTRFVCELRLAMDRQEVIS